MPTKAKTLKSCGDRRCKFPGANDDHWEHSQYHRDRSDMYAKRAGRWLTVAFVFLAISLVAQLVRLVLALS